MTEQEKPKMENNKESKKERTKEEWENYIRFRSRIPCTFPRSGKTRQEVVTIKDNEHNWECGCRYAQEFAKSMNTKSYNDGVFKYEGWDETSYAHQNGGCSLSYDESWTGKAQKKFNLFVENIKNKFWGD